ncbi:MULTISPECIES: hypothetical protein [unclassified Nocardioides]|uniref:hypothetical protein n=1 Tax=unclassified Nocardioides TaxID=2615069 RepID=UPI0000570CE4|nr:MULTISPECIES: hypothetical protein [unclassified Nocardioides]ABL84027.1 hypothetical protein Noca_4530 [Nocardioides sp. JS614]MBI2243945.1 hypothetical protein [Nocardioides sp.]
MIRRPRLVSATAAVAAAVMIPLLPAVAAAPVADGVYKGRIADAPEGQDKVSFTVTRHGRSVTGMRVGPWALSAECGSGGDPPIQSSKAAPIRDEKFTAHIVYRADDDSVIARATVTGKFLSRGREKGVVTTVMESENCPAHALAYTTRLR